MRNQLKKILTNPWTALLTLALGVGDESKFTLGGAI